MKLSAAPALALVLALLGGCKRTSAQPPTPPEELSGPEAPRPRSPYEVVEVPNGGTIRGRVVWQGERPAPVELTVPPEANPGVCGARQQAPVLRIGPTGGVQYTVVSLRGIARGRAPGGATPAIDQRGCQYEPHLLATTVGSTLRLSSSDPNILHTVRGYHGYRGTEGWFSRATPRGVSVMVEVEDEGVHTVMCDAGHTWMAAFVHAFAHPYHAVTDADGAFVIEGVPAGTYPLRAWHEGFTPGPVDANGRPTFGPAAEGETSVTVAPGGDTEVTFVLDRHGLSARAGT